MSGAVSTLQARERILLIRGHRVILDQDLAELYGVETRRLNEQIKRNPERFPIDFMFQLTTKEWANLKSQFATSSWGGRRTTPYAFTEHGAVMAASVLTSPEAVEASVFVVRAFIAMRDALASTQALARKLLELERKVGGHDETIVALVGAIRQLMETPAPKKRKIGFGGPE
ncbi:MAG TPA: ORF6N domain-containing protein [Holophagaceae bacterium]|nr:ORF6N domain-containing protein [Holophagaceae bacterium]